MYFTHRAPVQRQIEPQRIQREPIIKPFSVNRRPNFTTFLNQNPKFATDTIKTAISCST